MSNNHRLKQNAHVLKPSTRDCPLLLVFFPEGLSVQESRKGRKVGTKVQTYKPGTGGGGGRSSGHYTAWVLQGVGSGMHQGDQVALHYVFQDPGK